MIIDIFVILLLVLFVIIGYHRGIAKTLLNIAGIAVTCVLTYYVADFLADLLFSTFIRPQLLSEMEQYASNSGITDALKNSFAALPNWLYSSIAFILSIFGASTDSLIYTYSQGVQDAFMTAQSITDDLVAPVVTGFISSVISIVLFFAVMFVIKKLIKLVLKFFEMPVIKQFNKILGGILGAVEGILVAWIVINVFSGIMQATNPQLLLTDAVDGVLFSILRVAG